MKVSPTPLDGAVELHPDYFADERGYFMEAWNQERYARAGIDVSFRQTNISQSSRGVLRGLHYQLPAPQGKLVWVLEGAVYDVAVDIRVGSPQFGQWHGVKLDAAVRNQFYVPAGFAHGFCVLSEKALFAYMCTTEYNASGDSGLAWDDPDVGIDWPVSAPVLSSKDSQALRLRDIPAERLPVYSA